MSEEKNIEAGGQSTKTGVESTEPGALSTESEVGSRKSDDGANAGIPMTTAEINDNIPTENMEVHKHPHHVSHKKKWGEYILEFFILFLAVFLGFLGYIKNHPTIEAKILNLDSFNRSEARNLILFYKQMLVSTRTLQLNNYININHKILQELRNNYPVTESNRL